MVYSKKQKQSLRKISMRKKNPLYSSSFSHQDTFSESPIAFNFASLMLPLLFITRFRNHLKKGF